MTTTEPQTIFLHLRKERNDEDVREIDMHRHASGRGSPPDRSIRLRAYTHFAQRIYITNVGASAKERARFNLRYSEMD